MSRKRKERSVIGDKAGARVDCQSRFALFISAAPAVVTDLSPPPRAGYNRFGGK
jgi:hypothetical protein